MADDTERRRIALDRRGPPRPLRCMNCGVLLTFERRGCVVRLYRSGTAMPLYSGTRERPNVPAGRPRCVICNEPLVAAVSR